MPASKPVPAARRAADSAYYYRRKLGAMEILPAVGVAVGAGLLAFYITRLMLQRTPLQIHPAARGARGEIAEGTFARAGSRSERLRRP